MGLYIALDGFPPIAMLTLQSIKEPRGGRISFEIHQPLTGSGPHQRTTQV
jgi:hypothetical protein